MAANDTLRRYLTTANLNELTTPTLEQVKLAEELIDSYVAFIGKHVRPTYDGIATSGTTTKLIDTSNDSHLSFGDDYFNYCVLEILTGTNEGEIRSIISSNRDEKSVTVSEAFDDPIDNTSVYRIYQLGKFPRAKDVHIETDTYYKSIPRIVREAVMAQVDYIQSLGIEYFTGDKSDVVSESIDDYSYQLGGSNGTKDSQIRLIAPKARALLRGIRSRKGTFK